MQVLSGVESIKLFSFLSDFNYDCDNLGIHEGASYRALINFLTEGAKIFSLQSLDQDSGAHANMNITIGGPY